MNAESLRKRLKKPILTGLGLYPYGDPRALVGHVVKRFESVGWRDISSSVTTPLFKPRGRKFLDVTLLLDLSWQESGRFEHCRVDFAWGDEALGQTTCVVMKPNQLRRWDTVRVIVPEAARHAQFARVTFTAAPHCRAGRYRLLAMRLTNSETPRDRVAVAELEAKKEEVRQQVEFSEATDATRLPHGPLSLTLELTPRCNLSCAHCSTHGSADLHRYHNRQPEMPIERLEKLAHEVFPSLTNISISGRGESMLLTDGLWRRFRELIIQYRVMLAVTTNGYYLERCLTPELMPFIDNINVSMDGATKETFATNRGGADIDLVWRNIERYNALRKSAQLPRRPRLNFAWTLKRNNIAELPLFVRKIAELDADSLTARHLVIYFPEQSSESLVSMGAKANPYLREAYLLLEQHGIRRECVPLFEEEPSASSPIPAAAPAEPPETDRCLFIRRMSVIHGDGSVYTCAHPRARRAGNLSGSSFETIWNGETLLAGRNALNTPQEWDECRACWYREGKTQSQRQLLNQGGRYAADHVGKFSKKALDFT